jgi:nucleotide-binding universal stress UspA family protein
MGEGSLGPKSESKREGELPVDTLKPHRILIPVDGSFQADRAAEYVARYAGGFPACEAVLVHAQPAETFPTRTPDGREILVELADLGTKASAAARKLLSVQRLKYRLITELGDPADVVVRIAGSEQIDEIVMGSRGLGQWEGLIVGSVTHKVIHRAPLPITVVPAPSTPPTVARDLHRLLVAVDGSKHALHAVEYACELHAAGDPVEVELVTVVLPIPEGYSGISPTKDQSDGYYREEGESALRAASEVLRSSAIAFRTHITSGRLSDRIVELAETLECGRVVMGTRGLGSAAGLLLGSVAYRVMHLSSLPVTLVR